MSETPIIIVSASGPQGVTGPEGPRGPQGVQGTPGGASPADVATALADEDGEARATLNAAIEAEASALTERRRVAPSLNAIHPYIQPARYVLAQVGATLYAKWQIGAVPRLDVSTDSGKTWTSRGNLPAKVDYLYRAKSGTLLAIEGETVATPPSTPASPRVWRSTDDGTTWTLIAGVLNFPPLGASGIAEGTDGSIMICEYGGFRPWYYRIRRTTDDGLTWTTAFQSDGRDPGAGDNGHMHSVTYDPVAGRHNVFLDYTITGTDGPQIWSSADNGATWTMLGKSVTNQQPNFVTPMYFENYIAWGSDNEYNGRISRLKRSDFYAGRFHLTEHVQQVSQKAMYGAQRIRPGVYLVAVNGEHIVSSVQTAQYSTMTEVYVVSNEGLTVSSGVSSYRANVAPGPLTGVRAQFPTIHYDADLNGLAWVNFPQGGPRPTYAAVPLTQGWEPPTQQVMATATPNLLPGAGMTIQRTSDPGDVFEFVTLNAANGQVVLANQSLPAGVRAELQYDINGDLVLRSAGGTAGWLRGGFFIANKRLDVAQNGIGIRSDSFLDPNGNITAGVGCLYQPWGAAPWYKKDGTGTTGWRSLVQAEVPAADLASATSTVNTSSKYEGRQAFDTTADRPVWASGAAATAPWKYADGTTAVTPA